MPNTTEEPKVEFSDRMKETIIENLGPVDDETLTHVDNDTVITPNGDRYVGIVKALRYLQCSKTHFYTVVCVNNKIKQKRMMKRVYFYEVDLIEIANANKIRTRKSFSEENMNERKDEKSEPKQNSTLKVLDDIVDLRKEASQLYRTNSMLFGTATFFLASSLFLGVGYWHDIKAHDVIIKDKTAEILNLNNTKEQLEQNFTKLKDENTALNLKLAGLQTKGDQK